MNILMKHLLRIALAAPVAAGSIACGDDATGPGGFDTPDLTGTWIATSFTIALVEGGAFDPIAEGGSLRLDVSPDGQVVTTTSEPGGVAPDVDVGTIRVLSPTRLELRMRSNEDLLSLDYVLEGSSLRLSGRFEVDVTDDGVLRPADLEAVFVRQ